MSVSRRALARVSIGLSPDHCLPCSCPSPRQRPSLASPGRKLADRRVIPRRRRWPAAAPPPQSCLHGCIDHPAGHKRCHRCCRLSAVPIHSSPPEKRKIKPQQPPPASTPPCSQPFARVPPPEIVRSCWARSFSPHLFLFLHSDTLAFLDAFGIPNLELEFQIPFLFILFYF